ncbi:MAG: hypothetical protein NC548_31115 [Lachnospiraceae bacterium]|nr:hypothetical protein [Lachnospiraceae bacterium]MCM1232055.1 hypothetical protein [Ruminococcus flavefaciens]
MKGMFVLVLCAVLCALSVSGCGSTSGIQSETLSDGFVKSTDEVSGSVSYVHEDLELNAMFYNLHDSITGERENFRVKILNGFIVANCDYRDNDWLFMKSFVLWADSSRLQKPVKRSGSVNSTSGFVFCQERGSCVLSDDEVELLEQICKSNDVKICFIGDNSRTDVFVVKPRVKKAVVETVAKWREISK